MPTVAIHEILIHPRDNDLIVATHGRGVWILDDITPLQQLTVDVLSSDAHLFDPRPFTVWERIQKSDPRKGYQIFAGDNVDSSAVPISFYLGDAGPVTLEISSLDGLTHTATIDGRQGVQEYRWNLRFDRPAGQTRGAANVAGRGARGGGGAGRGGRGGRGGGRGGRGALGPMAGEGQYRITMTAGSVTQTRTLTVRLDPIRQGR
jgi:hypothetical protein